MSFQYIQPSEDEISLMQEFRDKYEELLADINATGLKSRGVSLAITNLEQSAMWFNKAITKNDRI